MTETELAKVIATALSEQAEESSVCPLYVNADDLSDALVDGYVDLMSLARRVVLLSNPSEADD